MKADPDRAILWPNLHVHDHAPAADRFAEALLEGLSQPEKRIPFRFLYDEMGSRLFERICRQPEYYLTRTEMQILANAAEPIAALAGRGASLVELGAGAGRKIHILLDAMDAPAAYVAIDISRDALLPAASRIAMSYPALPVHAVWADFSNDFSLPVAPGGRVVGFFPGSSIGNFQPDEACDFLAHWRQRLGPDSDMIVGVDLIKPVHLLEQAYNDAAGVTAAFTLNLLHRANREVRADFRTSRFRHEAIYNPQRAAIEIHLVSTEAQTVTVAGRRFQFAQGEKIHVEYSYKYDHESFAALAKAAGYQHAALWTDARRMFSVHYLRAVR